MRSSRTLHVGFADIAVLLGVVCGTRGARGESLAQGFAVERYVPADPGAGWLVMDELKLAGKWGAGVNFNADYAHHAYAVTTSNGGRLGVVQHQAVVSVGMAIFYQRYRLSLNIPDPVYASGDSGVVAGNRFAAPSVDPGKYPDKVTDFRVGLDARLLGEIDSPLRVAVSAQAFVPAGERELYASDGTWRGAFRVLTAGETGVLTYAGYLGVHVRPLSDSTMAGAPRGSEALAGIAAGPRLTLPGDDATTVGLGLEVWGATAFRDAFGKYTSALESLLGVRLQHTTHNGAHTVLKAGFGEGLHAQFGAPEWRAVFTVEANDRFE